MREVRHPPLPCLTGLLYMNILKTSSSLSFIPPPSPPPTIQISLQHIRSCGRRWVC
jgi:hypothetical protein